MIKDYLKHGIIYSITNILSKGISILLMPFYTRVLLPKDYGIVDILSITAALAMLIIPLEVSQSIARYYQDIKNSKEKIVYLSTAFWYTMLSYSLFCVVAWYFSKPLSAFIFGTPNLDEVFRVNLIYIWWAGIFNLLQNQLRWQLQPKRNAIVSIIVTISTVITTILLVLFLNMGVLGVIWGLISGMVVGCLISFLYLIDNFGFIFNFSKLKELLSFSLPLVPSSVGVFIAMYIDRISIKELMTISDVGIYGIGYRVAFAVNFVMMGFQSALTPLIYANYESKSIKSELTRIFNFFLVGALIIFLMISLFSREILLIFTTPNYYQAANVIPILIFSLLSSNAYLFSPGLSIAKKTKILAIINVLTALLNTILNILLIPVLGIIGSALATLISSLVGAILNFYLGLKNFFIPYKWSKICMSIIIVSSIVGVNYFIRMDLVEGIVIKLLFLIIGIASVTKLLIGSNDVTKIMSIVKIGSNK